MIQKKAYNGFHPELTVLTKPVDNTVTTHTQKPDYGGHHSVTRSLVEGLIKVNFNSNYNPQMLPEVGETVVVLSGIEALKQAIDWKRKGKIKKLLVGPNLMTRSNECDNILSSPEIDICIVPSDWVRIAYEEDAPALVGRIICWYAGVDENFWKPKEGCKKGKNVLVYWKTESEDFCRQTEETLIEHGWNPLRVVYGKYKNEDFKDILSKCIFAVFLSRSESQGLALAEAWSMNIPTLVWNPQEVIINGRKYSVTSSCPYLSDLTGREWMTFSGLDELLHDVEMKLKTFQPRKWVLENMTDEISARKLLQYSGIHMRRSLL